MVFEQLFQMLNPGGFLGIMTKLVKDQNAFSNWHYKQDPTHIRYFSRPTFDYLARKYSAEIDYVGNDVIIFQKY